MSRPALLVPPAPRAARALLALAALLAPAAALDAQQAERRTLAGERVAIYNVAGSIRLEPGSGSEVEVLVTRRGAEASRLTIETGETRGRPSLRVVYPSDHIRWRGMGSRSSTQFTMNSDGTFFDGARGGRRIRVTSDAGLDASADVVVRVPKGHRVDAYLAVGEASATRVEGDVMIDVAAADVKVAGVRGDVTLDTGSGEVSVSDVEGDVNLDTGSGDILLENLRGGSLVLDAGSGAITGRSIRSAEIRLDLGSGDTRLAGVTTDDLFIDSGSGEVDVAFTATVKSLRIDSGSGDVTLRLPASYGARVEVDTGSGGIDTELPISVTRRSRTMLVGTIGDGSGRMMIDSGSGAIRLVKAN